MSLQKFGGFDYNPEVIASYWDGVLDPTLTTMINSGAIVNDPYIASLINEEGCLYTTRFDNPLDGEPANYDGATNVSVTSTSSGSYTGVVYGRTKGWKETDFKAVISGHDPMPVIGGQIADFWNKYRQSVLIKILTALSEITTDDFGNTWKNHIANLTPQVGEQAAYTIGKTDLNSLAQQALGDNKDKFKLAIMHSKVATNLENQQVLDFWKYTDAMGIQRKTNIATANGYTVVVNDNCFTKENETSNHTEYTTYLLGAGSIRYAEYDLGNKKQGLQRDEITNGGETTLVTRIRETLQPQGFSYVKSDAATTRSPKDTDLAAHANWKPAVNPKNIAIAMLVTNG